MEAADGRFASRQTATPQQAEARRQSGRPSSAPRPRRRTRALRANGDHQECRAQGERAHGRSDGDGGVRLRPVEIPTGPSRSPHAEPRAGLATCARCRRASTDGQERSRVERFATSCRSRSAPNTTRCLRMCSGARLVGRVFASGGQCVQPSARPVFAGGNRRILPAALKQTHRLESGERSIQRAVGNQQPSVGDIAEAFGHLVPVKFGDACSKEVGSADANPHLERHQPTRFSSHGRIVYRYMRIVNSRYMRIRARADRARALPRCGTTGHVAPHCPD
jgi:hypothetical protein